jgi:uncharacterized protein YecE (DUF72 family)
MEILVGTSGWAYKDWNPKFFPPDIKGAKQLPYLSERFRTVEINASFYRMPSAAVFAGWRKNSNEKFVFSVKLNRYLTHRKRLILDDESLPYLKAFIHNASALKEKFAALLIQLPPNQKAEIERLDEFLKTVRKQFARRRFKPDIAIEFRHQSWFNEQTYEILRRHRVALTIGHSSTYPHEKVFTQDFSYIRLHGPGPMFRSKYSEEELRSWYRFMRKQKGIKKFYVYFNNDFQANAIDNATYLKSLVAT